MDSLNGKMVNDSTTSLESHSRSNSKHLDLNIVIDPNLYPSARRQSQTAKEITIGYKREESKSSRYRSKQFDQNDIQSRKISLQKLYLETVLDSSLNVELDINATRSQRQLKQNFRAKMNKIQLWFYDFKAWWQRSGQREKNPIFSELIKTIEGRFGSGIASFFNFTRWLLMINIFLTLFWFVLIVLPQALYFDYDTITNSVFLPQMFNGEGGLSQSWMFYGAYSSKIKGYPLSLIYLIIIIVTYFGGFFLILNHIAHAIEQEGYALSKSHIVFGAVAFASWDHSLTSKDASHNLSQSIANMLRDQISEVKILDKLDSLSSREKTIIFFKRLLAWLITILLIGGGGYLIFFIISSDLSQLVKKAGISSTSSIGRLLILYTPTTLFTVINLGVPLCIYELPRLENYVKGRTELIITVVRVFLLRMFNLIALVISIYARVNKGNYTGCTGTLLGQEFYRLVILDTIFHAFSHSVLNYVCYFWYKEKQDFHMAQNVLVLVYRQTLILAGTVVCPILPFVGVLSTAIFFIVNYFIVLHTCRPPIKRWSQSRKSTFFLSLVAATLIVLIVLISLVMIRTDLLPLWRVGKSKTEFCGPFGNQSIVWVFTQFTSDIRSKSVFWGSSLEIITSGSFTLPIFFVTIAIINFQYLRIKWEKERANLLSAELEDEKGKCRDLIKRLKLLTNN